MTLAVLGKESLSQLQRTVDDLFKAVPNRGSGLRPSERWLGKVKPFLNNQPLQSFNIVPVQVSLCCFYLFIYMFVFRLAVTFQLLDKP